MLDAAAVAVVVAHADADAVLVHLDLAVVGVDDQAEVGVVHVVVRVRVVRVVRSAVNLKK